MSGGPTVNYDGQVIGTNSFLNRNESQAFNFVGTSERILELMRSQGVEGPISQDTLDYRAGIDAYFAGDKETAVELLTAVTQKQPANGLASEYLSRSLDLPTRRPPRRLPTTASR